MATVNIGNIKLNWKGAYNGSTAYAIDDVVSYNGSSYVCIQASTGNLPTVTAYWEQMSAKGVDADLINITGTVQGDLYYNNGGAIARLGAGTSGQYLETQGSGANPQWSTISSDWVKLHTINHSGSNITSYAFDGHFDDSIYGSYKYIGSHRVATGQSTSNAFSVMRYNINGTEASNADYTWAWQSGYWNGSAGDQNRGNSNVAQVRMLNTWNEAQYQDTVLYFELSLMNPQSTTVHCLTEWKASMSWQPNEIASGLGGMTYESGNTSASTKVTGFTFRQENGNNFNFAQGTLYGLKK
jgi:hypothetical protein